MTLEHNTYKEAISDVKLPDDVGVGLVESAIQRKERRTQKFRVQAVAAIAGIMIIAFGANGVCYAQTGMNIWEILGSVYHKTENTAAAAVAEGFRDCGDSIIYDNRQFTVESYNFDPINCEIYYSIRIDSLDGTPLNLDDFTDNTDLPPKYCFSSAPTRSTPNESYGCSGGPFSTDYANEEHTSIRSIYHDVYTFENAGTSEDRIDIILSARDGEDVENGITYYHYKKVDSISLEPTNQMGYIQADGSALDNCTNIKITPGGICLYFKTPNDMSFRLMEPGQEPFNLITLKMKDGASYYLFISTPEGWTPLDESSGTLDGTGYQTPEGEVPSESILGTFSAGGSYGEYDFSTVFNSLININEIAALYVDGVEMPLK